MKPAHSLMIAVCLFVAFTIPASAAHTVESTFATDGIIIDGLTEDWGDWPVVYLEDSLRVVGVSHDADNLYIMYRFGDARLAEQLLHRGVVLWINGDGKKKNKNDAFGVRYPGSEEIETALESSRPAFETRETTAETQGRGNPAPPEGMGPKGQKIGTLTVIRDGIKETVEGAEARFQAASTTVESVFAYELRIPLDEIGGKVVDTPSTKTRKLAVGIQIGGLTEAEQESMEERMNQMREERGGSSGGMSGGMSGRGGGMGGPGGGGMGGPGGGGMGGPGGGGMGGRGGGQGGGRPTLDSDIDWLVVELPPTIG